MEYFFKNIIDTMREYQQINNITKQCITNTQFLYDCFKCNGFTKAKPKAFIIYSECKYGDEEAGVFIFHLALLLDDTVIEPSYEIHKLEKKEYFTNIQEILPLLNKAKKENKQHMIKQFLKFLDFERRMIEGDLLIANKEFYYKQADFVELNCKKIK